MPQMAPIWWSTLFLMFILSYTMIMMMIYYYNIYFLNTENKTPILNKEVSWKW